MDKKINKYKIGDVLIVGSSEYVVTQVNTNSKLLKISHNWWISEDSESIIGKVGEVVTKNYYLFRRKTIKYLE